MSNCRSACPEPGTHATFGECVRSAGIQMAPVDVDGTVKRWDGELNAYREARRQGMQPRQTTRPAIEAEKRRVGA